MLTRNLLTIASLAVATLRVSTASAHCDTESGPVITAARTALDTGNVNHVLIWVQPADEAAIRSAFDAALTARKSGDKQKADHAFFESLVRIHRAGEGAPFEGIKPAGTDIGPAVPAADQSIASGSPDAVVKLLQDSVDKEVRTHFEHVNHKKSFDPNNVAAGRDYVRTYVFYTHYIEGIHKAVTSPASHHEHSSSESGHQHAENATASAHHEHATLAAAHAGHAGHSGGHEGHVPWLLAGLFGLVAVGEGGWILSRRERPTDK